MTSCPINKDGRCDNSNCGWYNYNMGRCTISGIGDEIRSLATNMNSLIEKIDVMLQRNIQFVV